MNLTGKKRWFILRRTFWQSKWGLLRTSLVGNRTEAVPALVGTDPCRARTLQNILPLARLPRAIWLVPMASIQFLWPLTVGLSFNATVFPGVLSFGVRVLARRARLADRSTHLVKNLVPCPKSLPRLGQVTTALLPRPKGDLRSKVILRGRGTIRQPVAALILYEE